MKFLILAVFLLTTGFVNAQDKAERGKLEELKGMHRVFVNGSGIDRDVIVKQLHGKAAIEVVESAADADFYLTYKILRRDENIYTTLVIGELTAYLMNGEKVREVWRKEGSGGSTGGAAASGLAKKFLKDFEKIAKPAE